MPLHSHTIRNDRLGELVEAATVLGRKPIATAMTWPLAQIKRAARAALETYEDQISVIRDRFTVYEVDGRGNPVTDANDRPMPAKVYATNDDGSPKYKLDDAGEPTAEREVQHGRVQLTNVVAFDRELRELARQTSELQIPHLQWPQLAGKLKELETNYVEPLLDFFEGTPDEDEPSTVSDGTSRRTRSTRAAR